MRQSELRHKQVLNQMHHIKMTLLIGQYAQGYYLGKSAKSTLTETVKNYIEFLPTYLPLPHPSPRNNIWQKKNSWFADLVIPLLQEKVARIIADETRSS